MLEALPAAFGFSFIFNFNFNFNFKTISPRADDGTMPGAAGLQSKPFRHALVRAPCRGAGGFHG